MAMVEINLYIYIYINMSSGSSLMLHFIQSVVESGPEMQAIERASTLEVCIFANYIRPHQLP